jgi:hypothetical protein
VKKAVPLSILCFAALVCSVVVRADIDCVSPDDCRMKSTQQAKIFLPVWIQESIRNCDLLNPPSLEPEKNRACHNKIVEFSNASLQCTSSPERLNQMVAYDQNLLSWKIKDNGASDVPEIVNEEFRKLVAIAEKTYEFKLARPIWSLSAYQAKVPNAHAGANGEIMINSAFWDSGNPFVLSDIIAVLAHEIAHVVLRHSLKQGCMAFEGTLQMGLSLGEASAAVFEDYNPSGLRVLVWKDLSQQFEFEADLKAKEILKLAGFSGIEMAQALAKLKPKGPEGYSRGSHPGLDSRIERLK